MMEWRSLQCQMKYNLFPFAVLLSSIIPSYDIISQLYVKNLIYIYSASSASLRPKPIVAGVGITWEEKTQKAVSGTHLQIV
jgi:hypothetical protein